MQISIIVAIALAASSFGLLVLALTARVLAAESHKPHYAILSRQWAGALGLLLVLLVIHVVVGELVGSRGFVDVLGACLEAFPFGFATAGLAAVGLASAGGHALGVLHLPGDYLSRSGFRISAMVALVGLVLLPIGFHLSWMSVACSVLLALLVFAVLSLSLWHRHAQEAPWQLRTFVVAAPAGLLLLVLLAAVVVVPLPPLVRGAHGVVTLVDLVLLAIAGVALRRLMGERPDLRSLDARLTESARSDAIDERFAMEGPRHAGR